MHMNPASGKQGSRSSPAPQATYQPEPPCLHLQGDRTHPSQMAMERLKERIYTEHSPCPVPRANGREPTVLLSQEPSVLK